MSRDIQLKNIFENLSFVKNWKALVESKELINIYNVIGSASSILISTFALSGKSNLLVVKGEGEAQKLYANLSDLMDENQRRDLIIYPDSSLVPYEKISSSRDILGEQINVLFELLHKPKTVISTVRALFNPVIDPENLKSNIILIEVGSKVNIENLLTRVSSLGYHPEQTVEQVGEMRLKGGLLDIYSPTAIYPARIEFFGDQVESIRLFDPITQLSVEKVNFCYVIPFSNVLLSVDMRKKMVTQIENFLKKHPNDLSESISVDLEKIKEGCFFSGIDHYLPFTREKESTVLDYFSTHSPLYVVNSPEIRDSIKAYKVESFEIYAIEKDKREILSLPYAGYFDATEKKMKQNFASIHLEPYPYTADNDSNISLPIRTVESPVVGNFKEIMNQYLVNDGRIVIATKQKQRVAEILGSTGYTLEDGYIQILDSYLSEGFYYPEQKLALMTDRELFGWKRPFKHFRRFREGIPIQSIEDLKQGNVLVHYSYGIGIYRGLAVIKDIEGKEKEFLLMEYARGDKLYVPPERINMVNKYIGDAENITLSSLGTAEWERIREKARKGAEDMAKELLKLYANREISKGLAFSQDSAWQREMESVFPYEETPDQMVAIHEVKLDMESPKIMDRIVTGDVGYGKTEIAIRAAFKAIVDGYQVALLVPTTILANQHFETFKERFAPYPIEVSSLSRMVSPTKQKKIVKQIKEGQVDLVIGTHRLLSQDIHYKKLGLLIIDEEHKFGVRHKELISKLKENVDLLTLSATPIPRTLSMAISGIKEISRIDTSPEGRKPVKTYVMPYDDEALKNAIQFELARGGQIYYVHNKIKDIHHVQDHLLELIPGLKIGIAHGQMAAEEIDQIITDFLEGEIKLLLCTTIIESGIDIPTVNTIIIDNADKLGLAQMYQLRGRVGRSARRAYAYFFYPIEKGISKTALYRLDAIREFVELGSGLKIALRDLEIRGAGNFLGAEQSGHLKSVGYHLYIQLLKEAIEDARSQKDSSHEPVVLPDFPITGFIPEHFIKDEGERLSIYQQLVSVKSKKELLHMEEEFLDKYGHPPKELQEFYKNLDLRILAFEKGLLSVKIEENIVHFVFKSDSNRVNISVNHLSKLVSEFGNRIRFKANSMMIRKDDLLLEDIIRGVLECL
jgi:transcription-repair coupling factor (superfamily II helicase)